MTNSNTGLIKVEPTLSPLEALKRFNDKAEDFEFEGFHYTLEGPQMSPRDCWALIATLIGDEEGDSWFTGGGTSDGITEENYWFNPGE